MSRYLPNIILVVTIVALFMTIKPAPRPKQSLLIGQWQADLETSDVVQLLASNYVSTDDPMLKSLLNTIGGETQLSILFDDNGRYSFRLKPPAKIVDHLANQHIDSRFPFEDSWIVNWHGEWSTEDLSTKPELINIETNRNTVEMSIEWIDENTIQLIPPQIKRRIKPLTFGRLGDLKGDPKEGSSKNDDSRSQVIKIR